MFSLAYFLSLSRSSSKSEIKQSCINDLSWTSPEIRISNPVSSLNGEALVLLGPCYLWSVVPYLHAPWTFKAYFGEHWNNYFRHAFYLSFSPWYACCNQKMVFSLSQYSLNSWDVNTAPRSDTLLLGFPKQTAWRSKKVTTSSTAVLRVGYNHTCLEKASTITKMWLTPSDQHDRHGMWGAACLLCLSM